MLFVSYPHPGPEIRNCHGQGLSVGYSLILCLAYSCIAALWDAVMYILQTFLKAEAAPYSYTQVREDLPLPFSYRSLSCLTRYWIAFSITG